MAYTIYRISDGEAISNSEQPIANPDDSIYGIKETADRRGVWNKTNLRYEIPPIRSIKRADFLDRFTPAEQASLYAKRNTVSNIGLFFYKIPMYDAINLDANIWQTAVIWLENNRHISAGRAAEVLANG